MSTLIASVDRRRNANYKPNIWNYDHLMHSLTSKHDEDKYRKEVETLKAEVSAEIIADDGSEKDLLPKLELISDINKLALSHYFEEDISEALNAISRSNSTDRIMNSDDPYAAAALYFMSILTQYGYTIPQDANVIQLIKDDDEDLNGETNFGSKNNQIISCYMMSSSRDELLSSAIMCPLQRSVCWFNVKDNLLSQANRKHTALHKLARLSFNLVQNQHQKELKLILRWWKDLDLSEVLTFTRNRMVESFLWAVGIAYEPQLENLRKWLTKAIILILTIDDVYDIYGSMHELEQFTKAVQSWDPVEIQQLPEAIKKCFWTLHETLNEIDLEVQREKGCNSVLPHLKEVWTDFCKAMLVEAKWYHLGYKPSLEEYLENGCISSSGFVLSLHILLGIGQDMTDTFKIMKDSQEIIRHVSLMLRLCNDQATSKAEMERGDVPSSILCYMREANVTEREARDHVNEMITYTWKKIDDLFVTSPRSDRAMIRYVINVARVASFVYGNGDGVSDQDRETREFVLSCLIQPVTL